MTTKKIPFVDYPSGTKLSGPLPDGVYAQITYSNHAVGIANAPNPFPWTTTIFEFKDGLAEERGNGSNPAKMILEYEVAKIFFVGLEHKQKFEIRDKLAKKGIELIPE